MNLKYEVSSSGIFYISLLFLFICNIEMIHAQDSFTYTPGLTSEHSPVSHLTNTVEGELNILAVMVEFQPDSNRFTSGNGTFGPGSIPYLEDPGTNIDPLPHNQQYFEAHLAFTKNYFERMSDGLLEVNFQVLPKTYSLNKKMEEYSPIGEDPELNPLADLAKDVWELVTQDGDLSISLDHSHQTAFVIFHAGVGRDIQLTGTTLDKTPQDIPSVYLSRQALSSLLKDPTFTGFEIDNGNFLVDNTLILPRTLSRAGEDAAGIPFVLPLSINGLLTAQVGSHLGLPDLFNTETGESGIGRFGLMDGAGIFAYNGLFPPELSAWEKVYLGWSTPFQVSTRADEFVELPAASLRKNNSIAKVDISKDEYFLVENRYRDPDDTGVTLTIQRPDGTIEQQTFTNFDEEFVEQQSGFAEQLIPGVVVNVNNFDFALPGGFDEDGNRHLNGGILIWHIDDGVIRQKIGNEGINNNPDRRAVNLQEADGAQDIGRPTAIGISQNEPNGSAFDFWWNGNNASVITQTDTLSLYQNRFGPDTTPNNNSNSGAISFFEFLDFSDNKPTAEFRIRPVNSFPEVYELIDSEKELSITSFTNSHNLYWERYPLAMVPYSLNEETWILIPGSNGVQFYNPLTHTLSEPIFSDSNIQQPCVDNSIPFFTLSPNPHLAQDHFKVNLHQWNGESATLLRQFETDINSGFISSFEDGILDVDGTSNRIDINENTVFTANSPVQFSDINNGYQSRVEGLNLFLNHPGGQKSFNFSKIEPYSRTHTGIVSFNQQESLFYLLADRKLTLYTPESNFEREIILTESDFIDWPAFADFNSDGSPDFLYVNHTKNQLTVKNIHGANHDYFPISPPGDHKFIGTPLLADINGDGNTDILITAQDKYSLNIFGYTNNGEIIEGFPLHVGGISDQNAQPVHPILIEDKLVAVSHSGDFKMWEFSNMQNIVYAGRYGNQTNNKVSGFIEFLGDPEFNFTLLNEQETYNWPNPSTDETNLRFQTREQAEIRIKITTMSGRIIFDKSLQSRGGPPEEIVIDTSEWASGGYFALITASNNQHTERKLVKIAVAK